MNKKAIITGWCGVSFAKMASLTVPILDEYAYKCGADFYCENLDGERPASWNKVLHLLRILPKYEEVLWVDSDVVVERSDKSIFDEFPLGFWQGLVPHSTPDGGIVPNCGVWLLRAEMIPILELIWNANTNIDHPWWEQASILEQMGFHVQNTTARLVRETDLIHKTKWLSVEWNHHPRDIAKVEPPRFRHITQYPDRLSAVRHFVRKSDSALIPEIFNDVKV